MSQLTRSPHKAQSHYDGKECSSGWLVFVNFPGPQCRAGPGKGQSILDVWQVNYSLT